MTGNRPAECSPANSFTAASPLIATVALRLMLEDTSAAVSGSPLHEADDNEKQRGIE